MKLSIKLPLVFSIVIVLILAGGQLGLARLNESIEFYQNEVIPTVRAEQIASEVERHFSTAIQEWKNVLLRGKNPKDQQKYWTAHLEEMAAVNDYINQLLRLPISTEAREISKAIPSALATAMQRYQKAYEDYKSSDFDFAAGDRSARGADRELAKSIESLERTLALSTYQGADRASRDAARNRSIATLGVLAIGMIGFCGSIWISRSMVEPLRVAGSLAMCVAQGKLNNAIPIGGKDEVGQLLTALKQMQDSLAQLVVQVKIGSDRLALASAEVASGNQDLSLRTENQANALQETAAAMVQLNDAVRRNSDSSRHASDLALRAASIAEEGGTVVTDVVLNMRDINESSRRIAAIIAVIEGLAFQTNILALNASVESARAGDQGRGFAVVASEVRVLASRSAAAAKEIKALIDSSVVRVERGGQLVSRAGETMKELLYRVRRLADVMEDISAASWEQSLGVQKLSQSVKHIDSGTQQNAELVEEMAAAAASVRLQADELVHTVTVFTI